MDTNVLVAGACRHVDSRAYQLLMHVLEKRVPLILTPVIAYEYQEVLQRPAVMELTGLTHRQVVDLVTALIAVSRDVQVSFSWRPNLVDEGDNKFVEAAVHAAAVLVTYNVRHFAATELLAHGYLVMEPDAFLTRYRLSEDAT
jgi:predicted nucleic acid-binding protein